MAVLSRRGRVLLGGGAAVAVAATGVVLWTAPRHLPLAEAHRFMTGPVVVGDSPAPAPAEPAPAATVEERFAEAEDAFADGRYVEAGDAFAWVVAQEPSGPHAGPAQWNLTRSRLRSGDGTRALAAFEDLTRRYAGWLGEESPGLRRGLELMEKNELAEAQKAFEQMVRDQPDSELVPVAHALIARIHWTHREPMETVRSFARMFASVKDPVPAYAELAQTLDRYAKGDTGAAESFGRLAQTGDEQFRHLYQYLAARSLLEQDRFTAAHDSLEDLRRRFPNGDFSHIVDLEHAWNLLRNGRPADALTVFRRLEATPAPAEAHALDAFFDLRAELPMGVARCQLALERWDEAVAGFEKAIADDPHGPFAVENALGLAAAYEGAGRLERAAATLRTIVDEHPDEPRLWAVRQQLARVEGRLAAAR